MPPRLGGCERARGPVVATASAAAAAAVVVVVVAAATRATTVRVVVAVQFTRLSLVLPQVGNVGSDHRVSVNNFDLIGRGCDGCFFQPGVSGSLRPLLLDCRWSLKHFRFVDVSAAVSAVAGGSVVIRPSRADMDAE